MLSKNIDKQKNHFFLKLDLFFYCNHAYNILMKKTDAIRAFGTPKELADAINITRQAIYQWPEELSAAIADRVLAAAFRKGIKIEDLVPPEKVAP